MNSAHKGMNTDSVKPTPINVRNGVEDGGGGGPEADEPAHINIT
jgi:hypothetical protein